MPRKAEPGLAATYSKPRVLMTSTMKSDPGRSVVQTSTRGGGGVVSAAVCLAPGSGFGVAGRCTSAASCAFAVSGFTTSGAAPAAAPAAAPFKKPRRSTEIFLDLAMVNPPYRVVLKVYGNIQYFIMLELAKTRLAVGRYNEGSWKRNETTGSFSSICCSQLRCYGLRSVWKPGATRRQASGQ